MEKRYIYTKIWEDDWFSNLSRAGKLLFLYSFSNSKIGYTGYYESPDRMISFNTGLSANELEEAKKEISSKIKFYKGWVYVKNAEKFEPIKGDNNPLWKAYQKELDRIPEEIKRGLEAPMEGLGRPSGGSLGTGTGKGNRDSSSLVLSSSLEEKPKNYSSIHDLDESDVLEVAKQYQVPESFVVSKLDDMRNWHESTGKQRKNWKSTLKAWVKKDALSVRKEHHGKSKITYINE